MNDWLKKVEEMKKLRGSTTPEAAAAATTPVTPAPQTTTQTTSSTQPAKANPFLNKSATTTTPA
jgi:hypothetical protein